MIPVYKVGEPWKELRRQLKDSTCSLARVRARLLVFSDDCASARTALVWHNSTSVRWDCDACFIPASGEIKY